MHSDSISNVKVDLRRRILHFTESKTDRSVSVKMHIIQVHRSVDECVGARIRELRVNRAETTVSIANVLGVSPAMVEQWELGAMRIPAANLIELARQLTCPVSYFFGLSEGGISLVHDRL